MRLMLPRLLIFFTQSWVGCAGEATVRVVEAKVGSETSPSSISGVAEARDGPADAGAELVAAALGRATSRAARLSIPYDTPPRPRPRPREVYPPLGGYLPRYGW